MTPTMPTLSRREKEKKVYLQSAAHFSEGSGILLTTPARFLSLTLCTDKKKTLKRKQQKKGDNPDLAFLFCLLEFPSFLPPPLKLTTQGREGDGYATGRAAGLSFPIFF